MKKIFALIIIMLCFSPLTYATGYCPTTNEVQMKMQQFQMRAFKNIGSNSTLEQIEALNDEMIRYQESLVPNCIHYFQVTPNPDCNKLTTLATGYMLMDKNKQIAAKGQIFNVARPYQKTCEYQYMSLEMLVK